MKTLSRSVRSAVFLVAVCAGTTHAQAPAAAPAAAASAADKEARQRYAQSLSKGRRLADAKKLEEARQAFTECLTIAPDDPTALSELGWVELQLKDLEHAEVTTRKAVARADTPNLHAASLFNLGIIANKRGDRQGAIEAWNASLRLRPNATVLAELRKLDPSAAEKLRFAPHAMQGPFSADDPTGKSLRAKVCWQSLAQAWPDLEVKGPDPAYKCSEKRLQADLTGSGMLDVQVWSTSANFNWPKDTMTLAIRTAKGWYLDRFEAYWSNRWVPADLAVRGLELLTVGDKKVVTAKWHVSVNDWTWGAPNQDYANAPGRDVDTDYMIVAGVGPSGTPRVTGEIPWKIRGDYGGKIVQAEVALDFPGAGVLKFEGPKEAPTKLAKPKYKDLINQLPVGEFAVEYP